MQSEIQTKPSQEFYDFCDLHDACDSELKWIYGKTFKEFWDTCERGDWMLWFIWHKKDEPGWPDLRQKAMKIAEQFGLGNATREGLDAAADAAKSKILRECAETCRQTFIIPA